MPPDLRLFVDLPQLTELEITAYIVTFIAFAVYFWIAAQALSRAEQRLCWAVLSSPVTIPD